jgi:hypothetical protein
MITTTFTPPPHPSADAIQAALALVELAVNPMAAKQHIEAMARLKSEILDEMKKLQDERTRNQRALEAVSDLRAREEAVAKAEGEQQIASTRLAVASSAHSEREAQLAKRQADLDARARDLDARELALAERLKGYRDALA